MESIVHHIAAGRTDEAGEAIRASLMAQAAQTVADLRVELAAAMLDPIDDNASE